MKTLNSRILLHGLIAFALVLCLASCVPAEKAVRIATYNVENLFDSHDDPYAEDVDRFANGALLTKPQEELKKLADVITELDADVLGLQEVENRGFLEEFNNRYLSSLGYREVVLVEGNDTRGIDVAVLSRFPVGPVVSYRHLDLAVPYGDEPGRFSRDLLEVTIRPPGAKPFLVYVAHLKSRSGGKKATYQRQAEANKIREIWDARLKQDGKARFAFLADCNDDPPAATVRALIGSGARKVEAAPAKAPDGSVWTEKSRFSDKYAPIQFDYVFLSPEMKRSMTACGILRDPSARHSEAPTDHYPVWVDLKLPSSQ